MEVGAVFSKSKVTVSQSFLQKIPAHICKTKFFEETLPSLACTFISDGELQNYSLEGIWTEILDAQDTLISVLSKWSQEKNESDSSKQCIIESQNSGLICSKSISQLKEDGINEFKESSAEQQTADSLKNLSLNLQYSVPGKMTDPSVLCFQKSQGAQDLPITRTMISKARVEQPCTQAIPVGSDEGLLHLSGASENLSSQEPHAFDDAVENEVCVDIKLEHNYNHLRTAKNGKHDSENGPTIENEIYMDIQLSKPNNEIFRDPNMPVTLVVAKEDEPGVEVVQLSVSKGDNVTSQKRTQEDFQDQMKLRRKKYEEQAPYKYFCSQCSFKTKRHSHMRNHTRLHEKVCTIYSCDECDFSTIRRSHLQRHIGTHKTEVFACSECPFSTHTEALLTKHQRYKHILKKNEEPKPKEIFSCLHCDYSTGSAKHFERHLSVHTKKGRMKSACFKCSKCSYQTPSKSNYLRHVVVHEDERPYMCTTCGLCFKRPDTLSQHQSTHHQAEESERTHCCPECKKFYRTANALKEHLLTHEDDRQYLCEICAASFKTRAVQRKHYNQKHVHARIHGCSSCSKSFTSKYLLKRHMKVHASNRMLSGPSDTQQIITDNVEWCSSLVSTEQQPEDVQMIVVHQQPTESEVPVQEGPLFQITSSLEPGQALSVPVIPVNYIVPTSETNIESARTVTDVNLPDCASEGEIIAFTFLPEGSG